MNLALNPFDNGKKPEKVDEIKEVNNQNIETILNTFKIISLTLEEAPTSTPRAQWESAYYLVEKCGLPVLNPAEILVVQKKVKDQVYSDPFICGLIQQSYDNGFNDFFLAGGTSSGVLLDGKEGMLKLNIFSESQTVGDHCKRCEFNFDRAEYAGQESEDCVFNFVSAYHAGFQSKRCTFNIIGTVKRCGYQSKHCTFNFYGKLPNEIYEKDKNRVNKL